MTDDLRTSLGGKAVKWMERYLVHGEGDLHGKPYRLLPWHREFLWRWYELHPDPPNRSPWWYEDALVGGERGAVKTEFFGALAMLEMAGPAEFRRATPIIHVAAAALKQAGELFSQAQIMAGGAKGQEVRTSPLLGMFDVFDTQILYRDGSPGRVERVAADAGTVEGGKTTLFLGDELHEWTGRVERVYTVISAATTKSMHPGRVVGMSTAARGRGQIPPLESDPLLWRLYAHGKMNEGNPDSRSLFMWQEMPEGLDLSDEDQARQALLSMRCPDMTWSVQARLEKLIAFGGKMPEHEWRRYYGNQFTEETEGSWLEEVPGLWAELHDDAAAPEDGSEVVVGVDMALRNDSVGVVVAGQLSDGRVGWWHRVFTPPGQGLKIDHLAVFQLIAGAIAQRWKVRSVTYDPRFFEVPAVMLEDQGFHVVEMPQSPERLVSADQVLFDLVLGRQLAVLADPALDEHSRNAAWREGERGRYLSKAKASGHMDLIRAGSMATYELLLGEPPEPALPKPKIYA